MNNKTQVYLVGTNHVSTESVDKIKQAIDTYNPTIVCVELDKDRLGGLMTKRQSYSPKLIFQVGVFGYLFVIIAGSVQNYIAKKIGTKPGIDMLYAIQYAREKKISVALIDQNVRVTLRRFRLSLKEIFRFMWDIIRSPFSKSFAKELGMSDIRKIPPQDVILRAMNYIQKAYPSVYRVLIEERNQYMVARIKHLVALNPDAVLVVVVGAGHIHGMQKLLTLSSGTQ